MRLALTIADSLARAGAHDNSSAALSHRKAAARELGCPENKRTFGGAKPTTTGDDGELAAELAKRAARSDAVAGEAESRPLSAAGAQLNRQVAVSVSTDLGKPYLAGQADRLPLARDLSKTERRIATTPLAVGDIMSLRFIPLGSV